MAATPNPFWIALVIVAVALLFVLLAQMGSPAKKPAASWYSIAGQQEYTGLRASDAVLSGPYNPDLAFFPSENSSCSTKMKSWA